MVKASSDHPTDISSKQRRDLERTLPPGTDLAHVLAELERIKGDRTPPRQRMNEALDDARLCRNFDRALPKFGFIHDRNALAEQLRGQIRWFDEQAKLFEHIAAQKSPRRFLRQCEILWVWDRVRGDFGISSPRKKRLGGEFPRLGTKWAKPSGPVITYFMAAAMIVFGKAPGAHQIKDIVQDYKHLNFSAATGGWSGKLAVDATVIQATRAD